MWVSGVPVLASWSEGPDQVDDPDIIESSFLQLATKKLRCSSEPGKYL